MPAARCTPRPPVATRSPTPCSTPPSDSSRLPARPRSRCAPSLLEAGVTYGLVYRHFGTKDALLERLLVRYAERWQAHLGSNPDYARRPGGSARRQLRHRPLPATAGLATPVTGSPTDPPTATAVTPLSTNYPSSRPGQPTSGRPAADRRRPRLRLRVALLQPLHPRRSAPGGREPGGSCRRLIRSELSSLTTPTDVTDYVKAPTPVMSRPDQKRLDRLGALVGVDRFDVDHVAHDVVFQQDAVAAEKVARVAHDLASLAWCCSALPATRSYR